MYSSSTSFNPFQYTTITNSLTDIQNPNPIQQFPSSPFLQFPAPFLDDNGDLLLSELLNIQHQHHPQLQQNQHQQILGSDSSLEEETHNQKMNPEVSRNAARINNKKKKSSMNGTKQQIPRKRSGKKDRHSKIYTAHGPRDRRMRLSLQIARKFFDLQDMLGFDKASKTIDWLFTKSKAAIKELTDNLTKTERSNSGGCSKTVSSTSESEVMSGLKLTAHMNGDRRCMAAAVDDSILSIPKQKSCKKSDNKPIFNPLARESRNKARARARERTKEKLKIKGLDKSKTCSHPNPNNLEHLGTSGSVENGELLRFENQTMKSSPVKMVGEEEKQDEEEEEKEEEEEEEAAASSLLLPHQMDSISIVDKFLGLTGTTKSSSIFDLSHQDLVPSGADIEDEFPGFRGNWDISHGRVYNRYSAIPNIKISTTGNVHVQNPNAIFMTNPNSPQQKTSSNFEAQDQNLASVFMATLDPYEQNPRSLLTNFSYSNQQNPTPLPMATVTTASHSHFTENHFSCNPNPPIKYDSLY